MRSAPARRANSLFWFGPWKEREALEEEDEIQRYQGELTKEPVVTMDDLYAKEAQ